MFALFDFYSRVFHILVDFTTYDTVHGEAVKNKKKTRNSSGDEIANLNFLYDDMVHVLQNTIDSCIPPQIDAAVMCGTHVYQIK